MREDKITTIEHGHCCGTIITERYLANEDHNIMYWTQEVIGTGPDSQKSYRLAQRLRVGWDRVVSQKKG